MDAGRPLEERDSNCQQLDGRDSSSAPSAHPFKAPESPGVSLHTSWCPCCPRFTKVPLKGVVDHDTV